jgi:hypothetical protein
MNRFLFFSVLFCTILITSCKKNQLGGNATITGKAVHHDKAVAYASVFIKFNAKEFPGSDTTVYDAKVRADENGNFTIKCYKGNYYLYGFGYDYDISAPYHVKGGQPVKIRSRKKLEIDLAITED